MSMKVFCKKCCRYSKWAYWH